MGGGQLLFFVVALSGVLYLHVRFFFALTLFNSATCSRFQIQIYLVSKV